MRSRTHLMLSTRLHGKKQLIGDPFLFNRRQEWPRTDTIVQAAGQPLTNQVSCPVRLNDLLIRKDVGHIRQRLPLLAQSSDEVSQCQGRIWLDEGLDDYFAMSMTGADGLEEARCSDGLLILDFVELLEEGAAQRHAG